MPSPALVRDMYYGGRGVVTGTVAAKHKPINTPLRRRVLLIDERAGLAIRETWSDPVTGAYTFTDINPAYKYTTIAYDYAHNYRAVIADNLTLSNAGVELMP